MILFVSCHGQIILRLLWLLPSQFCLQVPKVNLVQMPGGQKMAKETSVSVVRVSYMITSWLAVVNTVYVEERLISLQYTTLKMLGESHCSTFLHFQ